MSFDDKLTKYREALRAKIQKAAEQYIDMMEHADELNDPRYKRLARIAEEFPSLDSIKAPDGVDSILDFEGVVEPLRDRFSPSTKSDMLEAIGTLTKQELEELAESVYMDAAMAIEAQEFERVRVKLVRAWANRRPLPPGW